MASAAASAAGALHMRRTAANSSGTAAMPAKRLGQLERRRGEAQQLHARDLKPQVHGRLVDRHAPRRLEGAEEEVVPREPHAAHGGVVERIGRHLADVEQPQDRRAERDQRRPRPTPTRPHVGRPDGLLMRGTLVSSPRGERGRATATTSGRDVPRAAGVYALSRQRPGDLAPRRHREHSHLPVVRRRRSAARRGRCPGQMAGRSGI